MLVDIGLTAVLMIALSIPLGVTTWAFLDAAKRPRWVWAFCGRRQVVWMGAIAFGVLTVIGGLIISGWYLARIRPELAAVEGGDLPLA